jgi:hypothetical protein
MNEYDNTPRLLSIVLAILLFGGFALWHLLAIVQELQGRF